MRQVSGFEDLKSMRKLIQNIARKAQALEVQEKRPIGLSAEEIAKSLHSEEKFLITGTFTRWSEKARQAGLLASTELKAIEPHYAGKSAAHQLLKWKLKRRASTNKEALKVPEAATEAEVALSTEELVESQDIMLWFRSKLKEACTRHLRETAA